ncbi:MAG: hypothetical protein ACR2IE_07150 [Candidatus Sumerlaeaceae bacterium]
MMTLATQPAVPYCRPCRRSFGARAADAALVLDAKSSATPPTKKQKKNWRPHDLNITEIKGRNYPIGLFDLKREMPMSDANV